MSSQNTSATAPTSASGQQAVTAAGASRIVPRPIPQTQIQDARAYQLGQLRKRFSPKESALNNGVTSLGFKIVPSDPDFPYPLDYLEVELKVPASFPKAPPVLSVKNKDIPRGFAINVERGWDELVEERRGATLLSLTNALDKNLESLLAEEKAETVKLTIYKDTRHLGLESSSPAAAKSNPQPQQQTAAQPPLSQVPPPVMAPYVPESFTREQIAEAKARRAQETRQLESRMGRLPMYQKSSDGIVYTLPLEPRRRSELPEGLQAARSLQLIIPLLYPLQQIRILLNDVDSVEAEPVEELFAQKAAAQRQMTLMSHLNYFSQSIHLLAEQAQQLEKGKQQDGHGMKADTKPNSQAQGSQGSQGSRPNSDRGWVHVIPRPPEWSGTFESGEKSSGSEDEDSSDLDEEDEGGAVLVAAPGQQQTSAAVDNAAQSATAGSTAITFPSIELQGVELLEISILSISVKCLRCKSPNDITSLKTACSGSSSKTTRCRKCAGELTATFRPEVVHQNSARAGFVILVGCTVTDLLPSTFIPTCARCSTPTSQGFVSVRGETTTNVCRECHARFTFKIPDVRFQTYSTSTAAPSGPRRRQAEKLGLHAGDPLPSRGACAHYKRSYRWFRFSCCDRVFPCDRCHDEGVDDGHPNEWANRMICGWCSREQNYRVDNCGFCGRSVVGRKGTGYWEGGKGTRDKTLMRRNDKRKYRRAGGGAGAAGGAGLKAGGET